MRVLLVEDDVVIREGIAQALAAELGAAVVCCGRAAEALSRLARGSFDLVVVDLGLPDQSGHAVLRAARTCCPRATRLVLTVLADDASIFAALSHGAHGYLLKDDTPRMLAVRIRQALAGEGSPLSPAVAERIVQSFWPEETGASTLSPRELELLELLKLGRTYEQAATAMRIGLGTVQSYVKSIYQKLDAGSKVEAVRVAQRRGLIAP